MSEGRSAGERAAISRIIDRNGEGDRAGVDVARFAQNASQRMEQLAKQGAKAGNFKTGLLVETVEGAETLKSGQGGWRMLGRWLANVDEARDAELQSRNLSEHFQHLISSFQQMSYVLLVAFGAWLVTQGALTQGGLIACTILSGRVLSPVAAVAAQALQWAYAKAALEGLDALWKLENDHHDHEHGEACDHPSHQRGHEGHGHHHHHDDDVKSFVYRATRPFNPAKLEDFLGAIVQVYGPRMLRYKGVLNVAGEDRRMVFQGVLRLYGFDFDSAWAAGELLAPKAAYIEVGAMLGTIMAGASLVLQPRFDAGEALRGDYERAQLSANITMRWDPVRVKSTGERGLSPSEKQIAARDAASLLARLDDPLPGVRADAAEGLAALQQKRAPEFDR